MAIISGLTISYKRDLLTGGQNALTDVIKIALYGPSASLGPTTSFYTGTGEVVASGYVAGGATLSGATLSQDGLVTILDFADPQWSFATVVPIAGALIYNETQGGRSIAVLSFGPAFTASGQWGPKFPEPNALSGLIRIN